MSKDLKNWFLLLLLACIWGSSFILMKKGMYADSGEVVYTDMQVGSLRMLLAGIVLIPFGILNLRKIKNSKQFITLATVGFAGNFFPAFLFTYAETGISSGFAGMLNSCTPIFTILLGTIFYNSKFTRVQLVGVILGTVGIISLMIAGKSISMTGGWIHILAVVVATFLYATSLTTIKFQLQSFTSFEITTLAFTIVFLPALVANYLTGTFATTISHPEASTSLMYIGILSVIGTAIAVILFNILLSKSSALFASSVTYIIPIVAVSIGLAFGENIHLGQVFSMILILGGVFVANYGQKIFSPQKQANNS
ncbi:MAG: DMT family transporter [Flavobacteriia bacterium]|jgi:drug/metabolite transporter (DMT)-like permease